ncbi:MAG: helix-turn-helix transcriptional regulator [Ruminococcaceae bacterium]|nr:helix-turn-helix transcriptional regulator [Oscillospiraceae bacterium]
MNRYVKIPLQKLIDVSSIVTAHVYDLRGKMVKGERHDFPEIFYVMEGNEHCITELGDCYLSEGQLIIYGANVYHGVPTPTQRGNCIAGIISFVSESPALDAICNKVITLTAAQKESYLELLAKACNSFESVKDPVLKGMKPRENADPASLQNIKNGLELFLLDILHNPDPLTNRHHFLKMRFDEVYRYFSANIHRQISSEQAAKELNMSVFFLRELIKKKKNCGITEYFISLKLDKAKELFQSTPMNVTEVSAALGFSSIHYFSRLFKKKTGLSPLQYIKTKGK